MNGRGVVHVIEIGVGVEGVAPIGIGVGVEGVVLNIIGIVVERVHVIGIGVGVVQIIGIGVATGRNHVNETEAEGVREVALVIMNVVVERKNIRRIVRRVRREVIRVNTPKVVRGL